MSASSSATSTFAADKARILGALLDPQTEALIEASRAQRAAYGLSPRITALIEAAAEDAARGIVAGRSEQIERGARIIRNDGTGMLRERKLADALPGVPTPHLLPRAEIIAKLSARVNRAGLDRNHRVLVAQVLQAELDAQAADRAQAEAA